ncbi:uncharacterized protein LOC34620376 [Cyclospora cayetanensis]|uniref:Uncharacterized protein LOC34620376 n=1 Tax=Cyclospora cayetanensis TaxID=88456 RepID=A0A6P6RSU9_9EIME|nr:uncharacterized protein LOC34620376 [Cyclospora cayetanensis]
MAVRVPVGELACSKQGFQLIARKEQEKKDKRSKAQNRLRSVEEATTTFPRIPRSSLSGSCSWIFESKRAYRTRINWMRVRFRARVSYFLRKSLKPKNHSKVLTRFRLTRFGWERLRKGRNGVKFNLTAKQFKKRYSITYVSRHDLKKFKYQTPGHKLRIRDPPIDSNPNIQAVRKCLPAHFG